MLLKDIRHLFFSAEMLQETNAPRRCNDVKQDTILHFERWSRVDLQKFIWTTQCLLQPQTRLSAVCLRKVLNTI